MTSKPYPSAFDDSFRSQGELTQIQLLLPPRDAFGSEFIVVDGVLRVGLATLPPQEKHAFECEFSLLFAELSGVDPPIEYSMEPEAFECAFTLEHGNLRRGLIVYSNYPPEAFECGFSIVSGSLT